MRNKIKRSFSYVYILDSFLIFFKKETKLRFKFEKKINNVCTGVLFCNYVDDDDDD
jgi:hypothetical protein